MVEPMFRAAIPDPTIKTFLLESNEGKHAANVRRMRAGEPIQVANGSGLRLRGTVSKVANSTVEIEVVSIEQESPPSLEITLVQALAKGDRDELAIQAATELGVMKVIPWQAENSVSIWDAAKAVKARMRWESIVVEASKQALRSFDPQVLGLHTSSQLVKSLSGQVLVLDPTAPMAIGNMNKIDPEVSIIVGPEGGISKAELAAFEDAGFQRIRLGEEILRTSTAGLAAISALSLIGGLWR